MSQIASGGGQPQKQPKYAAIYTGRFFNGLNTNRSPLRAASAGHIQEKFYSDASGDALITGANLEVSNRLTLVRRPGNPISDTAHTTALNTGYNRPLSYGDFRVNKAASDVFGTTLEAIYSMIDQTGLLQSLINVDPFGVATGPARGGDPGYFTGLNFVKGANAGQTFMQPVGNTLYFSDGVENKKWLTSLFLRKAAGNSNQLQGIDGLAGTYPFGTYLIDPATGNPQQFIGINIGRVTSATVASNLLTLHVTMTAPAPEPSLGPPLSTTTIKKDTYLLLWGMVSNPWLNGMTIKLANDFTYGDSTITADVIRPDQTITAEAGFDGNGGLIIEAGTTPVIAMTGASVPVWNTTVPVAANNFTAGVTLDGNTVWVNRGTPSTGGASVENWGIQPPLNAPTFSVGGQELAWQPNTYYSPASIFLDVHNNLWQVTTAGTTNSTGVPAFNASPTIQQKVIITSVAVTSNVAIFVTDTQSPALVAGDTVIIEDMAAATFLNGQVLTVSATGLSTTGFRATFTNPNYAAAADYGLALKTAGTGPPTTQADGTVIWTSIQLSASLTWQAHHHYNTGDFIVVTVAGKKQFFQLGPPTVPYIIGGSITSRGWNHNPAFAGAFDKSFPAPAQDFAISPASLDWHGWPAFTNTQFYDVNGAGEEGANTDSGHYENWEAAVMCNIFIPRPGIYTFTLIHDDGAFFSFDTTTGAQKRSGSANNVFGTSTVVKGYTGIVGNNVSGVNTDSASWYFPTAGSYGFEVDWCNWEHQSILEFLVPGPNPAQNIPVGESISGAAPGPVFPDFIPAGTGARWDAANKVIIWGNSVKDNQINQVYTWSNIGPVQDFLWKAATQYTLPGTNIIDTNGNQEGAYETGISGASHPAWSTIPFTGITADKPPLTWLNEGPIPALTNIGNTITETSTQGALYWIALVNTLDNTVSNLSPVSLSTGPFVKGQVTFAPGAGLDKFKIDPQSDYVAIFRSADGFTTPLLIPGFVNSPYTVPLMQYLNYGYVDTVPDTQLNNLITGPTGLENTPPAAGAVNMTYHLNRIWYSLGNTVFFTSGPLSPVGNGEGTAPGNNAPLPSQVKRMVPTAIGMIVFTQSDVYIIAGNGTGNSPILPAIPYLIGVGLGSHNALDVNGGLIGFYTTDKQFVIFDPSAGVNYVGFNIGDQFRLNNGTPGQSWDSTKVYVAWYVNGEDAGWYVADGAIGWYRMIYTPAPEQGSVSWSPFAIIQGGCGAIASVETSPGVHQLLIGQTVATNGNILTRNLDATTDNGEEGLMVPAVTHLGRAVSFGVLASSAVTGSTGAGSVIAGGDLGLYPGSSVTNFPPSTVTAPGVQHITDAVAQNAKIDLTAAISYYNGLVATQTGLSNLSTNDGGGGAGVYHAGVFDSVAASSLDIPTSITLDAQGNANAVFVFRAGSTVTLESGAQVLLVNGAQAGNVYWVVGSSFTSVWNGSQSDMVGTIMATVSVTLGGGTLHGRALAATGAVTMSTTETITVPTLSQVAGSAGTPYPAYGVIGSIVLANPGQIAKVAHITTICVRTGSPLVIGLILNEALPYFTGSFDILKHSVSDPPGLPESRSFYRQRFYLAENEDTSAYCMDLQILVQWPAEAAHNELQALTIFGAYEVEQ